MGRGLVKFWEVDHLAIKTATSVGSVHLIVIWCRAIIDKNTTIIDKIHLFEELLADDAFKIDEVTISFGHLDWVLLDLMHLDSKLEKVHSFLALDHLVQELNSDEWTIADDTLLSC